MLDSQNLFFVGGHSESNLFKTAIFASNDGGKNWVKRLEKVDGLFYGIYFINKSVGFAISGRGNEGELFKSKDGGLSWRKIQSKFPDFIEEIQFLDELNGYAICSDDYFLTTKDGGESWAVSKMSIKNADSFYFRNEFNGWILTNKGEIFQTKNRGKIWFPEKDRFFALLKKWNPTELEFKRLKFVDSQTGYLAVRFQTIERKENSEDKYIYDGGVVFSTRNGGKSWDVNIVTTDLGLWDAYFGQDGNFWVLTVWGYKEDVIFSSSDNGKTWERESIKGLEGIPRKIIFANPKVGWLVTDGGTNVDYIYRTEDSGKTWR